MITVPTWFLLAAPVCLLLGAAAGVYLTLLVQRELPDPCPAAVALDDAPEPGELEELVRHAVGDRFTKDDPPDPPPNPIKLPRVRG